MPASTSRRGGRPGCRARRRGCLEVVEAADAEERVAHDQDRPTLAHQLERAGDRAVLVLRRFCEAPHRSVALEGSMIEPLMGETRSAHATGGGSFAIVSVGVFMAGLDLFIVNIAFPDIRRDFDGTSLAGLCPGSSTRTRSCSPRCSCRPGGISDRAGPKARLHRGHALFLVASAACGAGADRSRGWSARGSCRRRRGVHRPDLARAAAARVPAIERAHATGVGRDRRRRRGGRPADRRAARRGRAGAGCSS